MSHVLLTGGAGFLGSHLSRALLDRGDSVVAVDNLLTGHAADLADWDDDPRFDLVVADVAHSLPVTGPFDAVLHFASPASPPAYLAHPLETLAAGAEGTRRTLELAREHGARYLLASTSEVYGDPLVHPQPESYAGNVDTQSPRAVYDEAKRFAETLTAAYERVHGVEARVVRIFNTYGPGLRRADGRVVSTFLGAALAGEPLTVHGDGAQTRSFCYVDDLVDGVLALLDSDVQGPVNLGNPEEVSMLELARTVLEVTGSTSEIAFVDGLADDPHRRRPDITRAREHLGWEPRVPLAAGLARTVAWFTSGEPVGERS